MTSTPAELREWAVSNNKIVKAALATVKNGGG